MSDTTTEPEVTPIVEGDREIAYRSEASPQAGPGATGRPAVVAPAGATGRRKEAVARVRIVPGSGQWTINGRTLEDYFPRASHRTAALGPFKTAGAEGTYDLRVRVHGGGISGQAGAVRHGIARALVEADPELRVALKREGYLTRDARQVERKKAGLHKARKAPQFSKR